MRKIIGLEQGKYYHLTCRGTNGEAIFREERNYDYFLNKWSYYMPPVIETIAFSMLHNLVDICIRVRNGENMFTNKKGQTYPATATKQLSHMLNSYAQGFNKTYHRTGSLFEHPFKRNLLATHNQLMSTIAYILYSPQQMNYTHNYRNYPFSSLQYLSMKNGSLVHSNSIFEIFGGKKKFNDFMNAYTGTTSKVSHRIVQP
jgi:hypothetical protein